MEIVPGLYRLLGRFPHAVNAFLWLPRAGAEPFLFDCGWPWSGRALVADLSRYGVTPEALRGIAITHDDVDHAGRLAALHAVSNAIIYAHTDEVPRMAQSCWRPLPGKPGPVDYVNLATTTIYRRWHHQAMRDVRALAEGDVLPGGWVVYHTPGHTPGHASYFLPSYGILIAGDALGPTLNGGLRAPEAAYSEDIPLSRASVRKLAALRPRIICCGHGPVLRNGAAILERLASRL